MYLCRGGDDCRRCKGISIPGELAGAVICGAVGDRQRHKVEFGVFGPRAGCGILHGHCPDAGALADLLCV